MDEKTKALLLRFKPWLVHLLDGVQMTDLGKTDSNVKSKVRSTDHVGWSRHPKLTWADINQMLELVDSISVNSEETKN